MHAHADCVWVDQLVVLVLFETSLISSSDDETDVKPIVLYCIVLIGQFCWSYFLWQEGYEDDHDIAGFIDFDILLDENSTAHEARIKRSIDQVGFVYHLFVNGCPIMEHGSVQSAGPPEILTAMYGQQGALPPEYFSSPPGYEESMRGYEGGDDGLLQSFSRQCGLEQGKKNN